MKRKPFILVAFLLCLYVIPTFASAASWIEVTSADMEFDTPDWNNITIAEMKFVTPEPPSDQSITGFVKTLPDDVLYYPDSFFANTTEALATNGDDDYEDSLAVDAVTWVVTFGTHETIYYDYNTELILDGFTYHHYGYYSSTPNPAWCALEYYNSFTDTWDTVMNFTRDTPVNPHWTNDTFYFPDKFTPLALGMRVIASSSDSSTGSTDYLGIEMFYLTQYSDGSYVEPFSDVSEWIFDGAMITTDDDIGSISILWGASFADWDYRKKHTITGASGAGTNYQVKLNVTRATGTDSGDTVFIDEKCQADFDDIRFTDNDGNTALDYWLETATAEYGIFWVEVTDSLESSAEIYIYYDSSDATSLSNGVDTFLFYDDFKAGSIDTTTNWTQPLSAGTESFSLSDAWHGQVLQLQGDAAGGQNGFYSQYSTASPIGVLGRAKIELTAAANQRLYLGGYTSALGYATWMSREGTEKFSCADDDNNINDTVVAQGFYNSYQQFQINRDGTNGKLVFSDGTVYTGSLDPDVNTIYPVYMYVRDSEYDMWIDYVAIRKFATTEPVSSTWGDEKARGTHRIYDTIPSADYQYYYYSFYAFTTTDTAIQYYSGSTWYNLSSSFSTTGHYFGIITDTEASSITRIGVIVSGIVGMDYLRISKANETGWSHDCATILGTDASSSDGDTITVSSAVTWDIDTTSNKSIIYKDHFPFMEVRIISGTGSITIDTYDGAGWDSVLSTIAVEAKTYRFNINAIDNIQKIRLTPTVSFVVDFVNLNGIANWSYYAPSATVSDYFYTEAGILYSEKSSNEYQQLTYDIELSTNTTIFEFANISTGVWTGTGDYSYGFDYDVGAGWAGYTYDETLIALDIGTLEAIRIIVRDSGYISAISFTDPLSLWWEAALAELIFRVKFWVDVVIAILSYLVGLNEFGGFFVLAGLVMIPTSTLFLVRGGKEDMNRDKIFLFFLIFLFGWAFVLGGLM